ncbi:hypothetical protein HBB16_21465 [Pseudonocardia sp. MCCB 268]|nr:hypothetical protein [Pseudonocardia cytotoxica]
MTLIDTNDVAEDTRARAARAPRPAPPTRRSARPCRSTTGRPSNAAQGSSPPSTRRPSERAGHGGVGPDALRLPRRRRAPDTVHPGLWRMAQLNSGITACSGSATGSTSSRFRYLNMTVIGGDAGFIVIDPLTCVETARAAIDLGPRAPQPARSPP